MLRYAHTLPLVNVAEAWPKKSLESPHIGQAVCRALLLAVDSRLEQILRAPTLILGFGAVGEAVAKSLRDDARVPAAQIHVFDPASEARARAKDAGFVVWRRDPMNPVRFGLVVGCSGSSSFSVGDRAYLADGAILASASSGSVELSRESFIELADTYVGDDIYVHGRENLHSRSIHSEISLHLVDCEIGILNGGFPVNFDGQVNCVDPRYMQPTRALMAGAAVQALEESRRGILEVNAEFCRWVVNRFRLLEVDASL
jgi:hypothetical protein